MSTKRERLIKIRANIGIRKETNTVIVRWYESGKYKGKTFGKVNNILSWLKARDFYLDIHEKLINKQIIQLIDKFTI